jgi:hypothetical protein
MSLGLSLPKEDAVSKKLSHVGHVKPAKANWRAVLACGFKYPAKCVSFRLKHASETIHCLSELNDRCEIHLHLPPAKSDGRGKGIEADRRKIAADERARFPLRDRNLLGQDLGIERGHIVRLAHALQEAKQHFPVNQARGPDLDHGQHFEHLLGGPRLQFEEPFEVSSIVVRPNGVQDGLRNGVQAGKPGDRTGHGRTSRNISNNASVEAFRREGNECAIAH